MFVLQNDKAETNLNANFGLFTIDGNKTLYNGIGHYNIICGGARHTKIVSINF